MKLRIRQNVWGNIYAYAGKRRVKLFGEDWREAQRWLIRATEKLERIHGHKGQKS